MKRALVFILIFLLPLQSFAAAVPAYNGRMNDAIAGVVSTKLQQRGFAANDPRFVATMGALGSGATTLAVGVGTAVVAGTAIAWLPLLTAAGIATVVGGAVALAADSLYSWIWNSDGTVSSSGAGSAVAPLVAGGPYWVTPYGYGYGSSPEAAAAGYFASTVVELTGSCVVQSGGQYAICDYDWRTNTMQYPIHSTFNVSYVASGSPYSSDTGSWGSGAPLTPPGGGSSNVADVSPTDAIANIPDAELSKPLNPVILAAAANALLQSVASQPNYAGLPADLTNPITAADVSAWTAANPSLAPTVADAIAPVANGAVAPMPSGTSVPIPANTSTATNPTVNTSTNPASAQPQVNLGADPNIGAPVLEGTPTAAMILAPLLNLFPDLKSFVVPAHDSVCPKPSMTLFEKNLVLDGHCTLLDSVKPTLYAVMAFVWVILALFIILAA